MRYFLLALSQGHLRVGLLAKVHLRCLWGGRGWGRNIIPEVVISGFTCSVR